MFDPLGSPWAGLPSMILVPTALTRAHAASVMHMSQKMADLVLASMAEPQGKCFWSVALACTGPC